MTAFVASLSLRATMRRSSSRSGRAATEGSRFSAPRATHPFLGGRQIDPLVEVQPALLHQSPGRRTAPAP